MVTRLRSERFNLAWHLTTKAGDNMKTWIHQRLTMSDLPSMFIDQHVVPRDGTGQSGMGGDMSRSGT